MVKSLDYKKNIFYYLRKQKCFLSLLFALFFCTTSFSQLKNEDDLKKQANQFFEEEEYNSAYKLFAQLVSLYPKDPEYNYKLGVCMLYTEPDKKKPYSYLQVALKNPADAPKEAKFYLAKTYHINYRFDEAIKYYTEYKQTASSSNIKKLEVDREIQACKNGKRLLSNLSDLIIINKKQLNEEDYFKAYDIKSIGGKLLVKPDEYKSGYDKRKKDKSVVYLPKTAERLYYSSYGDGGNNGRDIYYVNKLPNGSWSKATLLPSTINSEYDEDYPFLHPNGKTLYFSSKGHNSMGGYDVFKTTYNSETQTWSKPENLEFPINSPDDDILFVTDSLEKTAYFSTGRYSPYKKIDVLKINTERRPMNSAIVKGTIVKENAEQSINSKITVKNMANGEIVGTFQAEENGNYNMEIPNGGKFIFTVETPGIPTQADGVQIPVAYTLKPYRQMISYENKILKITNYFDGSIPDENYSMMLDLIEKKAKLEVNENEPYNNALLTQNKNQVANANSTQNNNSNSNPNNSPTLQENNSTANNDKVNTNKNITNEQLLEIAKTDAKEAADEAVKLKQDAQDAFGLATQKNNEAEIKQNEANQLIEKANAITDVAKKNEEINKAHILQDEAKIALGVSTTANNLAKKLEADADLQQKEADLNNQYINQLETVIKNKNNKEALDKLTQIQTELDNINSQKNQSNELLNSLKAENELKQQELLTSEKKTSSISSEITSIKTEIEALEKDLSNENDKSIKENISAQIRELNTEIDLKNTELATNNKKITSIQNQLEGIKQEIQFAEKILNVSNESIAINNQGSNNNNSNNTVINNQNNNQVTSTMLYTDIVNKYSTQLNTKPIESLSKNEIENQNKILNNYNTEIDNIIAVTKNELSKTNNSTEKKKITDELKKLEQLKSENAKSISNNNEAISKQQNNIAATNNNSNNESSSNINSDITQNNNESKNDITSNSSNTSIEKTDINSNNSANNNSSSNANITNNSNNLENNTVTNIENNSNSNPPVKNTSIENENISEIKAVSSINKNANSNNNELLNQLNQIKDGISKNSEAANQLFSFNDYKENTSIDLKNNANQKLDIAKQNEQNLKNSIQKTETQIKNASGNRAEQLALDAENLNNSAYEKRKEAASKTGQEKELLLKEAIEIEKNAVDKKLEASVASKNKNKSDFDLNQSNLTELQKLTQGKESNEISQANMLIDEAAINFKQAQKLREEADAYPNGAAKLGGLSNAEEKENEALRKQKTAIDLLIKSNPTFKPKTNTQFNSEDAITNLNSEINKVSMSQADAYIALSNANQNELKLQSEKLTKNPSFAKSENKQTQTYKADADKLMNEAKALLTQSAASSNASEKANLLLKANKKEIDAIKKLQEANTYLASQENNSVATNNTTNNTITPNTANSTSGNVNSTISNQNNISNENSNSQAINQENSENLTSNNQITSSNSTEKNNSTNVESNTNTVNNQPNNGNNDDLSNLKSSLNNKSISSLLNYNYSNTEAVALKNKASETINKALEIEKQTEKKLDDIISSSNTSSNVNQNSISSLIAEAEKLNNEASALRKSAANKTGTEKENEINSAKKLEAQALDTKVNAAQQQEKFNASSFVTNKQSLTELASLAKGKNIAELNNTQTKIDEINATYSQAKKIREEANAYPNQSARLGGYGNAEEKENEALKKQEDLINLYKKHFPNYTPKSSNTNSNESVAKINDIKNSINSNNEQYINGLNFLYDANVKEYQSKLNSLANNLTAQQTTLKTNAENLYNQSQELNTKAKNNPSIDFKKAQIIEANQIIQQALETLNKINSENPSNIVSNTNNNETVSNTNSTNTNVNSNPNSNTNVNSNASVNSSTNNNTNNTSNNVVNTNASNNTNNNTVTIKVKGLDVKKVNAYSDAKPIPIDEKMPDGLVFKVQIGAFKAPLPNNTFKGLDPVIAQTTTNGYIRYMAGDFEQYNDANAVKNDLRNLGYADAFVVAYFNGKRIALSEATEKAKTTGQTIVNNNNISAGIVESNNVPRNTANVAATNSTENVVISGELEKINGLLYTVQIGVYSKQVTASQLFNLKPIYTEKLPSGLYRYTAGIYNQSSKLLTDKKKVIDIGVKDAFVSAYYNAKRIPFTEGQKIQSENNNLKLETENPIIFPSEFNTTTNNTTTNAITNTITAEVTNTQSTNTQPTATFNNGVTEGPAPTAENGVKSEETGISFKVQIGAYKNQIPNEVAAKFLNIKTWPVKTYQINGLYIYTIGNFVNSSFAKKLKDEAVSLGITDAFITVYKDGKKIYGSEATQNLNK